MLQKRLREKPKLRELNQSLTDESSIASAPLQHTAGGEQGRNSVEGRLQSPEAKTCSPCHEKSRSNCRKQVRSRSATATECTPVANRSEADQQSPVGRQVRKRREFHSRVPFEELTRSRKRLRRSPRKISNSVARTFEPKHSLPEFRFFSTEPAGKHRSTDRALGPTFTTVTLRQRELSSDKAATETESQQDSAS